MLALAFLMGVGVMVLALLSYAEAGTRSIRTFRDQRANRYLADAAIEQGIAWAKDQPKVGIDDASADPCALNVPGGAGRPTMLVTCEATAGSGSGLPTEVGSAPEFAILTLGQRDREAPSYTGSSCIGETGNKSWDPTGLRGSNRIEYGIRFSKTTAVCVATRSVNQWTVKGKVFSNSPIVANPGGGIKLATSTPAGSVQARGGCVNMTCTDAGRSGNDPLVPAGNNDEGQDPRTDNTATATERASWNLPSLAALTKRAVPDVSLCGNGKVVTFEPGWYDDIEGLNNLFKANACKGTTFWFAPARGTDGNLLGPGYKQGLYYFNFEEGNGGGCNYYSSSSSTAHQWCIGNAYDSNQNVVAGTPLGWSPFAQGTGSTQTLPMTTSQVDSFGTTFWSPSASATKIDGASASYTNNILAIDRPITLKNFSPKVPLGAYNSNSFNIKVAHSESGSFNAPKITVSYDSSLFGSKTCGTYTLRRGNYSTAATADELNATDRASLARCLNQGDKINGVKVKYTITGCNLFCGSTPTFNGVTLEPDAYPDQPKFPESAACDPTKPGVQMIFGGDSHVYVADGNFEVCAGPAAQNTLTGQQIGIYGVPAIAPMRPKTVAQTTKAGNTSGTANLDNAKRIAEPTGGDRGATTARVTYTTGNCGFCSPTIKGGIDLTFAKAAVPANTTVTKVTARVAYNSHGIVTGPQLELPCTGGNQTFGFSASHGIPQIDGTTQASRDVTSCMQGKVTGADFTATWWARTQVVCAFGICSERTPTDDLDGVEFIVEVRADGEGDNSNPTPVPAKGCVTGAPNYWNSQQGGDGTCAVLKADQTKNVFNSSQNSRGRISVKGTIYVPSGAIDVDDEDVLYPFFGRGLVARTLMLRGFRYRTEVPVADIPPVDRSQKPREVTFTTCTRPGLTATDVRKCGTVAGDRVYARARVRFEADKTAGLDPAIRARVPKVLWYSADR